MTQSINLRFVQNQAMFLLKNSIACCGILYIIDRIAQKIFLSGRPGAPIVAPVFNLVCSIATVLTTIAIVVNRLLYASRPQNSLKLTPNQVSQVPQKPQDLPMPPLLTSISVAFGMYNREVNAAPLQQLKVGTDSNQLSEPKKNSSPARNQQIQQIEQALKHKTMRCTVVMEISKDELSSILVQMCKDDQIVVLRDIPITNATLLKQLQQYLKSYPNKILFCPTLDTLSDIDKINFSTWLPASIQIIMLGNSINEVKEILYPTQWISLKPLNEQERVNEIELLAQDLNLWPNTVATAFCIARHFFNRFHEWSAALQMIQFTHIRHPNQGRPIDLWQVFLEWYIIHELPSNRELKLALCQRELVQRKFIVPSQFKEVFYKTGKS